MFAGELTGAIRLPRKTRRWAAIGLPAFAATATTAAAAAAAAAATATVTTATAAATAATTAATVALRTSFVDGDRAAIDLGAVEGFDRGAASLSLTHRNEGKTARAAGIAIRDHGHFFHLTVGPKLGLQRFLRR